MNEPEEFREIPEFPLYAVSNYGRVVNLRFGREMTYSPTQYGDLTVGLMKNAHQHRRSVKKLVAQAWVPGESLVCDTPIQKDGDRNNLHYTNLAWRPRWFAWKYHRQFEEEELPSWVYQGPVFNTGNVQVYESIIDAAMFDGVLMVDILQSIQYGTRVFPEGHLYKFT